jgi:hypothetical protein
MVAQQKCPKLLGRPEALFLLPSLATRLLIGRSFESRIEKRKGNLRARAAEKTTGMSVFKKFCGCHQEPAALEKHIRGNQPQCLSHGLLVGHMLFRHTAYSNCWLFLRLYLLCLIGAYSTSKANDTVYRKMTTETDSAETNKKIIRYANIGNSMQFFNNFPILLENMLVAANYAVAERGSYLRSNASLKSLWTGWRHGLDSLMGFSTAEDLLKKEGMWDFIIVNDHSQWPAREATRQESLQVLQEHYIPLLKEKQPQATVVLIQTKAYRVPNIKGSKDLGDFDEYTEKLTQGIKLYKEKLDEHLGHNKALIAPVGLAFSELHKTNQELWKKLYFLDNFHPSPYGSLLQAFVVFWTITGEAPPTYNMDWWNEAKSIFYSSKFPNEQDGQLLYDAAMKVCKSTSQE